FLFDGSAGTSVQANDDGSLSVTPPQAAADHVAAVEALASDGQTSSQLLGASIPPSYTYPSEDSPWITVSPANLIAGTDTMIEIDGFKTNFVDGQTVFGFGISDITVKHIWIQDSGHALLNISVGANANLGLTTVTAATGLQLVTLNNVLMIQPPADHQITLRAPVVNEATVLAGLQMGGNAQITVSNIPANPGVWTLTVGGAKSQFTLDTDKGVLHVVVPTGLPLGPAVVQLTTPNGDFVPPILA